MTANEIALNLAHLFRWDTNPAQTAKSGIHTIRDLVPLHNILDHLPPFVQAGIGVFMQCKGMIPSGDSDNLGQGKG
jgi:hypothetical protein